jgi:hypothetical protein
MSRSMFRAGHLARLAGTGRLRRTAARGRRLSRAVVSLGGQPAAGAGHRAGTPLYLGGEFGSLIGLWVQPDAARPDPAQADHLTKGDA